MTTIRIVIIMIGLGLGRCYPTYMGALCTDLVVEWPESQQNTDSVFSNTGETTETGQSIGGVDDAIKITLNADATYLLISVGSDVITDPHVSATMSIDVYTASSGIHVDYIYLRGFNLVTDTTSEGLISVTPNQWNTLTYTVDYNDLYSAQSRDNHRIAFNVRPSSDPADPEIPSANPIYLKNLSFSYHCEEPVYVPETLSYIDVASCSYDTSTLTASCVFEDFSSAYTSTSIPFSYSYGGFTLDLQSGNSQFQLFSQLQSGEVSVVSFGGKDNVLKVLMGTTGFADGFSQIRLDLNFQSVLKDSSGNLIPFNTIGWPDYTHVIEYEYYFDINPTEDDNSENFAYHRSNTVYATGGSATHTLSTQTHTADLDGGHRKWNTVSLVLCDQYVDNDPTKIRQLDVSGSGSNGGARALHIPPGLTATDPQDVSNLYGPSVIYISKFIHKVYPRT